MVCQPRERESEGENTASVHSSHCETVEGEGMIMNSIKDSVLEWPHEVFFPCLFVL